MPFDLSQVKPFEAEPQQQPTPVSSGPAFDVSKAKPFGQEEQSNEPPVGLANTQDLSFVTGFADSVNKMTTGILKAVTPSGGAIEKALNNSRGFVQTATALAERMNPVSTGLGELSGMIAQSIPAVRAAKFAQGAGKLAKLAVSGPAVGAAYGVATNPEGMTRAEGAALGAGLGAAGSAISGLTSAVVKRLPANKMAKFFAEGEAHPELKDSASRLGIEISPFETTSSVNAKSALAAHVKMNPEMSKALSDNLQARDQQLQTVFQDIRNSVAVKPEEGTSAEIYKALKPRQIPTEKLEGLIPPSKGLQSLLEEPQKLSYAQRLYQEAHSLDSGLNFDDITPGSFEDILKTRQFINDKIKSLDTSVATAGKAGKSSGSKGAAATDLKEVKSKLTDALMSVSSKDELPVAEKLVKREGFISSLDAQIGKIKLKPGQDAPDAEQIHDAIAGTAAKKEAFLKGIEKNGGNIEAAKDFVDVVSTLKNSPVKDLLKQNPHKGMGITNMGLGSLGAASYALGPVGAGIGLAGMVGNKVLSSRTYFNQIFKDLPEQQAIAKPVAEAVEQTNPLDWTK